MNSVLWGVQVLLALVYLMAGSMKLLRPIDALGKQMDWVTSVPVGLVRFIGLAELLGALGLILPMVTGIAQELTVAAAAGLVAVQVLAAGFHVSRHETQKVPANLVLLLLAAFVIVGRVAIVPIA